MKIIHLIFPAILFVACQSPDQQNENAKTPTAETAVKAPAQRNTLEERKLNGRIKSILRNTSENIGRNNNQWTVTDTASHYEIENFDLNGYVSSQSNYRGPGIPLFAYKYTHLKNGSAVVAYVNEEAKGYFSNTYTDDFTLVTAYNRLDARDTILLSRSTNRYEKASENYTIEQTEYSEKGAGNTIHTTVTRTTKGDTTYQLDIHKRDTQTDTGRLTIITLEKDFNKNPVKVLYLNPSDTAFKPYIYLYKYDYYPAN